MAAALGVPTRQEIERLSFNARLRWAVWNVRRAMRGKRAPRGLVRAVRDAHGFVDAVARIGEPDGRAASYCARFDRILFRLRARGVNVDRDVVRLVHSSRRAVRAAGPGPDGASLRDAHNAVRAACGFEAELAGCSRRTFERLSARQAKS